MDHKDLDRHLEAGQRWGFIKETGDPEYLGWVLLRKRKPRPVTAFDPREPERYAQFLSRRDEILRQPYYIHVVELKRDVYERGDYETSEDQRNKENHYFADLEEAVAFLNQRGYSLDKIRPAVEIDAP